MESSPIQMPSGPFKLTLDEYLELPNDGKRYQILDGDLDVTPAPSPRHQQISRRLQRLLEDTDLGEVFNAPIDLVLDRHNVVQPDLVFIRKERLADMVAENHLQGVPDLVVEVLSPSTRRTDVLVKSRIYASFGVPAYWILDPDVDRMELFRVEGNAYVSVGAFSSPSVVKPAELPGLEIPLATIFG